MVEYVKVPLKVLAAIAVGAVTAELGVAGTAALVNDAVAVSGVSKPKVVGTKGHGLWKKAVVQSYNPLTGQTATVEVKLNKKRRAK